MLKALLPAELTRRLRHCSGAVGESLRGQPTSMEAQLPVLPQALPETIDITATAAAVAMRLAKARFWSISSERDHENKVKMGENKIK